MPPRRRRGASDSEHDILINADQAEYNNDKPTYDNQLDDSYVQPAVTVVKMTARDRTHEFADAINTMQRRTVVRAVAMRNPRQARHIQTYSNFMMIAKNIGKNIASTYAKLEKLTLCKFTNIIIFAILILFLF